MFHILVLLQVIPFGMSQTTCPKKYIVNKKALPNEQSKQLAPASDSAANTIVKLQNLEALVRSLQGVAEELNNRLDNLISDLDSRLASLSHATYTYT